jgi:2-haloacid dehalogenase
MTKVVVLDVNETLSDISHLAPRLEEIGAPGALVRPWFASTLRDGFALACVGTYADFAGLAEDAMLSLLAEIDT